MQRGVVGLGQFDGKHILDELAEVLAHRVRVGLRNTGRKTSHGRLAGGHAPVDVCAEIEETRGRLEVESDGLSVIVNLAPVVEVEGRHAEVSILAALGEHEANIGGLTSALSGDRSDVRSVAENGRLELLRNTHEGIKGVNAGGGRRISG